METRARHLPVDGARRSRPLGFAIGDLALTVAAILDRRCAPEIDRHRPPLQPTIDTRSAFSYYSCVAKGETAQCLICREVKSSRNGTIGEVVRPSLSELIHKHTPQWDGKAFIFFADLGRFRCD